MLQVAHRTAVHRASLAAALGSSLLAGCRKDAPPAPPSLTIEPPSSGAGETVTCRQKGKSVSLVLDDAGLHLRLETARGNRVTLLGREVTVDTTEDASFPDALARFADAHALDKWLDVDVKVSTPDGRDATDKVQIRIDRVMAKRVEGARTAGVRFPGETLAASANKLAYVRLSTESRPPFLIGDGRLRDIDLVAFESVTHGGGKNCGVKRAAVGSFGGDTPIVSQRTTSRVELYDRRAGKRVDEASFTDTGACPDEGDAADDRLAPNEVAIRAWVASKLASP
jgi:hypothetical protein